MPNGRSGTVAALLSDEEDDGPVPTRHFLYADARQTADEFAKELAKRGFEVVVDLSAIRGNWLVLATHMATTDETLDRSWTRMENLAKRLGATYDGHEIEFRHLPH